MLLLLLLLPLLLLMQAEQLLQSRLHRHLKGPNEQHMHDSFAAAHRRQQKQPASANTSSGCP
jgi:hypothetical protein